MTTGLRLGGLSSGLDTEAIVSALMAVERRPRGRIERQQAAVQARQDALRDISTKLKALKTAASNLTAASSWAPTQSVTSADAARVGARGIGSITPGTYDVEVQQLATAASQTWNTRLRPNPSQLIFTVVSSGSQYTVDLAPNATTDDIVARINSDANAPVVARNFNGQLLLSAKASGAGGNFTVTGQALNGQTSSTTGVDAQFTVNGASYTRSSNNVTDVVAGLELTLNGQTTSPVTITVGAATVDGKALAAKMKAFVDAYNAVVDATRSRTSEKRVPNAETTTDAKKGVLFGDTALTQMLSQLRNAAMDPLNVGNSTSIDELAEIGVSTGNPTGGTSTQESLNGRLVFDEAKFLKAFEADPASVERVLRGTTVQEGFATRLDNVLKPLTEVGGLFDGRITASASELSRLGSDLKRMDARLLRKEEYLRRQFTSLETALSRLNSQGAEMMSRLGSLPQPDDS